MEIFFFLICNNFRTVDVGRILTGMHINVTSLYYSIWWHVIFFYIGNVCTNWMDAEFHQR